MCKRFVLLWLVSVVFIVGGNAQRLPTATPRPFSLLRCTPLPVGTQMHGCAVVGQRVYVMGGNADNRGWTMEVSSAPILPNFYLGAWRRERSLPEYRSYISQSVEVVNDRIYIVGGSVADTSATRDQDLKHVDDVLWTRVRSDGTLEEWRRSERFTASPTSLIATCSNDKHLFVLGGSSDAGITANTYVCDFDENGAPVRWRPTTPLPTSLWFHGAAILEDTVYVWGGLTDKSPESINPKTYSATVFEDGTLGIWREETPMPYPTYSSTFCGFNDYIVAVGGRYKGAIYTNAIWFARLDDKRVGPWQVLTTDLEARVYHGLGLDKAHGVVYVTGGRVRDKQNIGWIIPTVQAFQITQPKPKRLELTPLTQAVTPHAVSPERAETLPMTPSSSPQTAGALGDGLRLDVARQMAKATGKQVLVFFYSPEVPGCKRFWESVVRTSEFASLAAPYVFATYDVTREDPQLCARYGIFKFPALAVTTADGELVKMSFSLRTLEDAEKLLGP